MNKKKQKINHYFQNANFVELNLKLSKKEKISTAITLIHVLCSLIVLVVDKSLKYQQSIVICKKNVAKKLNSRHVRLARNLITKMKLKNIKETEVANHKNQLALQIDVHFAIKI